MSQKKPRIQLHCKQCNKEYEVKQCVEHRSKYCSKHCQAIAVGKLQTKRAIFEKTCPICQSKFMGRKKTSDYCSTLCGKKAQVSGFKLKHEKDSLDRITVACAQCGKPKTVPPCRYDNARDYFCSRECKALYQERQEQTEITCKICGTKFSAPNFFVYHENPARRPKYCSKSCMAKGMSINHSGENNPLWVEKISIACQQCNESFSVTQDAIDAGRKFCSHKCACQNKSQVYRRENHWLWKGGKPIDYGPDWLKISAQVRKRDNQTCKVCGKTKGEVGKSLDVHHIKPLRSFDGDYETANHPDNLITLCASCHKKEEHKK